MGMRKQHCLGEKEKLGVTGIEPQKRRLGEQELKLQI